MVLELFAICEGAFAKNGQLTIVNTLDSIKTNVFPMILNIGIATKIKLSKDEYGLHNVTLGITNSEGISVAPEMKVSPEVNSPKEFCNLVMSTNIQGIRIEKPDMYFVSMNIDGVNIAKASLEIQSNG